MSEQVIQIKMKSGIPLVSNEMRIAVQDQFKIDVNFGFQSTTETIDWETCKEIYRSMAIASVGNAGEIKTLERCIAVVDPPKQRIIPCLSVLFQNGDWTDRMVINNQSAPQTLEDWALLQDKLTQSFSDSNPKLHGRAKPVIISYIELFEEAK